jgi:hypothetical protein
MAARKKTQGLSPKTPAAATAALLAPLLARLLADWLGIEVGSETAEGLILAVIAAVSAAVAAYAAPPGAVVADRRPAKPKPSKPYQGGYGAVEVLLIVFLAILCLVALSWLL